MHKLNDYKLPFGCHAWEKYDSEFWSSIFAWFFWLSWRFYQLLYVPVGLALRIQPYINLSSKVFSGCCVYYHSASELFISCFSRDVIYFFFHFCITPSFGFVGFVVLRTVCTFWRGQSFIRLPYYFLNFRPRLIAIWSRVPSLLPAMLGKVSQGCRWLLSGSIPLSPSLIRATESASALGWPCSDRTPVPRSSPAWRSSPAPLWTWVFVLSALGHPDPGAQPPWWLAPLALFLPTCGDVDHSPLPQAFRLPVSTAWCDQFLGPRGYLPLFASAWALVRRIAGLVAPPTATITWWSLSDGLGV